MSNNDNADLPDIASNSQCFVSHSLLLQMDLQFRIAKSHYMMGDVGAAIDTYKTIVALARNR